MTFPTRRITALSVAVLVAASVTSFAPAANAVVTPSQRVMVGTLTDAAGKDFAVGTPVNLLVQPSSDVLKALAVGQSVNEPVIATTTVTSGGAFSLSVANSVNLSSYADSNGVVNFVMQSAQGNQVASYFEPLTLANAGAGRAPLLVSQNVDTSDATAVASATAPAPISVVAQTSPNTVAPANGGPSVSNKEDLCSNTKVKSLASGSVYVGGIYNEVSDMTGWLDYSSTKSSQIGVSVSATGSVGSFTEGGTSAVTGSVGFESPMHTAVANYVDKVPTTFAEFRFSCTDYDTGKTDYTQYSVSATGELPGGIDASSSTTPTPSSTCGAISPGVKSYVDSGTAYTYSNSAAVSVEVALTGISISSQTDHSTDTEIHYTNRSTTATRHICYASKTRVVARS
jgi:hypothetical protein